MVKYNDKTKYFKTLATYEKAVKESAKQKTKEYIQKERAIKAETKKGAQELRRKKYEQSQKEKKAKKWRQLAKKLSKPITSKRILKKERPTLTIKQREVPSVLGDPNRFFKDEMQKEFEL